MRISDWSSDVCSSDLVEGLAQGLTQVGIVIDQHHLNPVIDGHTLRSSDGCRLTPGAPARNFRVIRAPPSLWLANDSSPPKARIRVSQIASPKPRPCEIGRASCRERVCQYV